MTSATPHVYRELSPHRKDIRILTIQPGLQDGVVSGSLGHVSLLDLKEPYDAISWYWGDPKQGGAIKLDGEIVDVPLNAALVLKEIVSRGVSTHVWLDAICINQKDLIERASQVSLMKDVYSCASKVFVWLGHDDGFGPAATSAIDSLVRQCQGGMDNLEDYEDRLWLRQGKRRARWFTYSPLPEGLDWAAIRHIYSVPLFTRTWIVQEISLAKNPICLYGKHTFPWVGLGIAAEWMIHRSYERAEYCRGFLRGVMNASIICAVKRGSREMDKTLMSAVHFDCSEPRDNIFGLLGLIPEPEQRLLDRPDYTQPVEEVFIGATRAAIEACGRLWLLSTVTVIRPNEHAAGMYTLPSWVPQYAAAWRKGPKGIRNFSQRGCDNMQPLVIDNETPDSILRVKGVRVATVANTNPPLGAEMFSDIALLADYFRQLLLQVVKAKALLSSPDLSLAILYKALAQWDDYKHLLEQDMYSAFLAFLYECQQHSTEWHGSHVPVIPAKEWNPTASAFFQDHLKINALQRTFFVTDDGQAGQATSEVQSGDHVCILFGSELPFILRRVEDHFILVGTARLPDVMDGQYIAQLERCGQLDAETAWFEMH